MSPSSQYFCAASLGIVGEVQDVVNKHMFWFWSLYRQNFSKPDKTSEAGCDTFPRYILIPPYVYFLWAFLRHILDGYSAGMTANESNNKGPWLDSSSVMLQFICYV